MKAIHLEIRNNNYETLVTDWRIKNSTHCIDKYHEEII